MAAIADIRNFRCEPTGKDALKRDVERVQRSLGPVVANYIEGFCAQRRGVKIF